MSNVYEASKPTSEPAPGVAKSNCGCWVAGCLSVVLLGIVIFAVMIWLGVRFAGAQIEKYTDDTPQDLPVVEYEQEQLTALETRLEDFKKAVAENKETEDLILTADDINALIAKDEQMKGKIFVEIKDGQIIGDVSLPLDMLPLGVGKGRYFNASASFEVSVTNGILVVTIDEATVKGEPVPEEFMQGLRSENLAKDFRFEGDAARALERIDEVIVEEGKIVLKAKPVAEEPEATTETDSGSGDTAEEAETTTSPGEDSETSADTASEVDSPTLDPSDEVKTEADPSGPDAAEGKTSNNWRKDRNSRDQTEEHLLAVG